MRLITCLTGLFLAVPCLSFASGKIDECMPEGRKELCSDEIFVRRLYLTLTGSIPAPEKAAAFINDKSSGKRAALIDELLDSELYLKYMQMHWGDILRIKSEFPSNLWPNGVQAYNRWLYKHLLDNTSYREMVRELLLSSGSNFRCPAVNFYRAFQKRTPENFYSNVNLLFLADRDCRDNGYLCFSQISFKSTKEWKEEIIYLDIHKGKPAKNILLEDGTAITVTEGQDWREAYVDWLTSENNRRFAEVISNRLWFWMTGESIIPEPDRWGAPSNAKLLKELTDFFIRNGYDMKKLVRYILNSGYFQSATYPQGYYRPQRLPAEVIVDALADVTGIWETYQSRVPEPFTFYPPHTRSTHLGDATVSSSELELFGKVSRDVSLESQRNNSVTSRQLLYLMNSQELEDRIRKSPNLQKICTGAKDIKDLADALTLLTLSRKATPGEIELYSGYMSRNGLLLKDMAIDMVWMHINSNEFLFNH